MKTLSLLTLLILSNHVSSAQPETAFQQALKKFGVQIYSANLHAHHFMELGQTKKFKNSLNLKEKGPCVTSGRFTQDDGRPCRNQTENGVTENSIVPLQGDDPAEYFEQACRYAQTQGELDILFITAHTKDAQSGDTDTRPSELNARHELMKNVNSKLKGKFYCGLGQEASSISAGNHINVMGQFLNTNSNVTPFYFKTGHFDDFYSQVAQAKTPVILQFNHPEVHQDLWWNSLRSFDEDEGSRSSKNSNKKMKEVLNDYGLDDFAPVGCMIKKRLSQGLPQNCERITDTTISFESLKATFEKIREAANDRFRLIEIVGTQGYDKEGNQFGATTNPHTEFFPVHQRHDSSWVKKHEYEGLYDYVFYLSVGFKLAPTANQDNHHMNWGSAIASRTGVLAKSLEENHVLGALNSRRTFATEDKNAKVIFYTNDGQDHLMGDEFSTKANSIKLSVGYYDPDKTDSTATIKVYSYAENEDLDFNYRAPAKGVFKTLALSTETEPSIKSGEVKTFDVPLKKEKRYFFIEITQEDDLDKVWSAPIWVSVQ